MTKYYWLCSVFLISAIVYSCAKQDVAPATIDSPDEQALYDLMVLRVKAMNNKDMDLFKQIYIKNSPEIPWIEKTGLPLWQRNGMQFRAPILKRISIIVNDAAATFRLSGRNEFGNTYVNNVEVLYVKVNSKWKIESTGAK